jgi:hypothetical protein
MTVPPPAMPDLAHPSHGFHHTLDSALTALASLGVSTSRITVRMVGRGWPESWIVGQFPAPGVRLVPDVNVTLAVSGLGLFHSLPAGMWESGGEMQPGTKELLELIDDPLRKASHWMREGARLFDIDSRNPVTCARWIRLFGIEPESWPVDNWHTLALVLPTLHRSAGKEPGIRLTLQLLLGLPLSSIRRTRTFRRLEDADLTQLSWRYSRLGVDLVVGDRLEDLARMTLVIGPVALKTYYDFQSDEKQRRLAMVLALCTAQHQDYRVSWLVMHPERAPRLGIEEENSKLGVNTHLGTAKAMTV